MQKMYVKFNDVEQVKHFVNVVNRVEANFEIGSGKRVVDPRSILGIFSLDLTQPQELRCDSDELPLADAFMAFHCNEDRRAERV